AGECSAAHAIEARGYAWFLFRLLWPSPRSLQMSQRQWRPCLKCLNSNIASDLADDREVQKLADQETLIMFQIGDDDFKEVIRFAGNEMAGNDLRHRTHGS